MSRAKLIIISSVIIAVAIFAGALYLGNKYETSKKQDAENKSRVEAKRQKDLDECLEVAEANYYGDLRFYKTGSRELNLDTDYNSLPISTTDLESADADRKDARDACFHKFD